MLYGNDTIDLKDVITLLLNKLMKKGSSNDVQAKGLVVCRMTNEKGFGKSKCRSQDDVECYYCHKKVHINTNCPKLKN